jgi:hypothetical protein
MRISLQRNVHLMELPQKQDIYNCMRSGVIPLFFVADFAPLVIIKGRVGEHAARFFPLFPLSLF